MAHTGIGSPNTSPTTEAAERAGTLVLALARAAASPVARVRLRTVLQELSVAVDAGLVACYVAGPDETLHRVASVSSSSPVARKQLSAARGLALRAATTWWVAWQKQDALPKTVQESDILSDNGMLLLPLEATHRWLGIVIAWSEAGKAAESSETVRQTAPMLALVIPPLIESARHRAGAGDSRRPVGRGTSRASASAAVRDEYLAALAHELRNPLNTLGGFLEIVLNEQVGPLNERQRQFLEYARDSAARIATVIEQARVDKHP